MDKLTISIGEISITIPEGNGQIDDAWTAVELALELYGWHRNTIEEHILARAEEIQDNRKDDENTI
jgi:hypothetical protein